MTSKLIRLASEGDADALQAIYAPIVQYTAISFELEVPTVAEMRARIGKTLVSFPWLVCEDEGQVLGYVYASKHRERAAYQWSVDVTAYVHENARHKGVARGLYVSLNAVLRLQGYYSAFAGIALPNDASIGLHKSVGFEYVGVYKNVGFKLGKWHDVSWWGLLLQPPADNPHTPLPLSDVLGTPEAQAALAAGLRK